MEESPLVHLDLRAPLAYEPAPALDPFTVTLTNETTPELLFCYAIDPNQANRIDPEAGSFLGELLFSGKGDGKQGEVQLPAGLYLFSQQRGSALTREECIHRAIEQQKDGLWERLQLENLLYIRCLFEDASPVTQLFRPYS